MKTWARIKHDTNGNPRHVCSWLGFGFSDYASACLAANKLGGRRYHNKQYGGGIVFQSYECELPEIERKMIDLANNLYN